MDSSKISPTPIEGNDIEGILDELVAPLEISLYARGLSLPCNNLLKYGVFREVWTDKFSLNSTGAERDPL